jgi:ATP-dependent Clp protease protease subunit
MGAKEVTMHEWLRGALAACAATIAIVLLVGQAADDGDAAAEAVAEAAEGVFDRLVDANLVPVERGLEDPLTKQRVLVLSGDINARMAATVSAQLLYLDVLDPIRPIDLYLRTEGGWGDDAYAICDVIAAIRPPVNTWAAGSVNSAGAAILAAGTGKRRALPSATVMLHIVEEKGDERYSDALASRKREEAFWRRHAKLPAEFFPMDAEKEYYLSAKEALEFGIVDEIWARPK